MHLTSATSTPGTQFQEPCHVLKLHPSVSLCTILYIHTCKQIIQTYKFMHVHRRYIGKYGKHA